MNNSYLNMKVKNQLSKIFTHWQYIGNTVSPFINKINIRYEK